MNNRTRFTNPKTAPYVVLCGTTVGLKPGTWIVRESSYMSSHWTMYGSKEAAQAHADQENMDWEWSEKAHSWVRKPLEEAVAAQVALGPVSRRMKV